MQVISSQYTQAIQAQWQSNLQTLLSHTARHFCMCLFSTASRGEQRHREIFSLFFLEILCSHYRDYIWEGKKKSVLFFEGETSSTLNCWEQIDMHSKKRLEHPLTQNTTFLHNSIIPRKSLSPSAASTGSSGATNTAALSSHLLHMHMRVITHM